MPDAGKQTALRAATWRSPAQREAAPTGHSINDLEQNYLVRRGQARGYVIVEVMLEMKERGFDFLNIDLYGSDPHIFRVKDGKISIPLTVVPSLGETVADSIARERVKEKFKSMEDLTKRTKVNKNVVEFLTANNIAAGLPASDQIVLF